jgi:hypothetical protein
MKKIVRLTESDLTNIVKKILNEGSKSSPWDEIWYRLRKMSSGFDRLDDKYDIYTFGGLDFRPSEDDTLELLPGYRNPKNWRDDYEDGVKVLEKYEKKLKDIFDEFNEESNLPFRLHVKMNSEFNIILSIK